MLQEPDVRLGARMSGLRPGCPARRLQISFGASKLDLGAEIDEFGGKIDGLSWMENGDTWGYARSTRNQANPWIKINKTSSNQQITKKIGVFLVGNFQNWGRTQQNQARKQQGEAPKS